MIVYNQHILSHVFLVRVLFCFQVRNFSQADAEYGRRIEQLLAEYKKVYAYECIHNIVTPYY